MGRFPINYVLLGRCVWGDAAKKDCNTWCNGAFPSFYQHQESMPL